MQHRPSPNTDRSKKNRNPPVRLSIQPTAISSAGRTHLVSVEGALGVGLVDGKDLVRRGTAALLGHLNVVSHGLVAIVTRVVVLKINEEK